MATADKLKKYVTAIADAIREKEGSTELINPQDFVSRINSLGTGGGIPNVPTLECWKINLSSLSDEEPDYLKTNCINTIKYFISEWNTDMQGKGIIFSEVDGTIYGGWGPEIIYGSSYQEMAADIVYMLIMNIGTAYYLETNFSYIKAMLEDCGEQISLSDFLSIAAQAQNYENINGYA